MKALSSKQVLQENHTTDFNAITSLTLTHRALSDVLCLSEFKKLERLDLTFNSLSSLEGLKSCVNLKWLSVKQNKLRSLKGVEGLSCLTVLNAGSNMLQSMEEVSNLVRLRALILNDNEIVSICRLDQMKELNTLVLSRNPICKIGESLGKANSITKLSLSHCKIQCIDSSIKSCSELRELRLAHNEIRTLPSELTRNTKIQNLDLGNNLITRWSDLKTLSSFANLKNLNLAGNPIAEKDGLPKKIKKLVPSLHIFNARPIDKPVKTVMGGTGDCISVDAGDIDVKKGPKMKKPKTKKTADVNVSDHDENTLLTDPSSGKKSKRHPEDGDSEPEKTPKKDAEAVSLDVTKKDENRSEKREGGVVTFPKKNKRLKSKNRGSAAAAAVQLLSPEAEVGLGGQSAWDVDVE